MAIIVSHTNDPQQMEHDAKVWDDKLDGYLRESRTIFTPINRKYWSRLTDYQRLEYCREARFLHNTHKLTPAQAVGVVRRMIRIGQMS